MSFKKINSLIFFKKNVTYVTIKLNKWYGVGPLDLSVDDVVSLTANILTLAFFLPKK